MDEGNMDTLAPGGSGGDDDDDDDDDDETDDLALVNIPVPEIPGYDTANDASSESSNNGSDASLLAGVLLGGAAAILFMGVGVIHLRNKRQVGTSLSGMNNDKLADAKRVDSVSESTTGLTTQQSGGDDIYHMDSHDIDSVMASDYDTLLGNRSSSSDLQPLTQASTTTSTYQDPLLSTPKL
jgi:hypothetical protein